ncbi:MAG: hypothetical protein AB7U82_21325 [Blastocatellales bacterium]
MNSFDSFTLAPMSAGDIIDRAVRLYRRNFLALLRIVIAPSLVAYAGSILISIGWRNATLSKGDTRVVISVLMILGGSLLWLIGKAAFYAVLGASSRSLVAHFFEGKPILARDVYRALRERIWSLIGATLMIGLLILGVMMIAYFFLSIMVMIFALVAATVASDMPGWMQTVVTLSLGVITIATLVVAALLVYSRIVYVPQILMVEGKGVFTSISRSFALAGGQIRRIAALFLFWIVVGWSVLWLLFFPLESFAYWIGVDITPFNTNTPVWYSVAQQTVTQLSEILLMPIAMLGFTLLYLDSRVRKEGFDVELLANRTLAPPPDAPPLYPLAPQQQSTYSQGSFAPSILGLNDYSPAPLHPVPEPSATVEPSLVNGASPATATIAPETSDLMREAVEFAPTSASAISPDARKSVVVEASPQEVPAAIITAEVARKGCQWCGAEASVEDRFCKVCGSVF